MFHVQLDDRFLWGNEAADDEDPLRLNAYFVEQKDWSEFLEPTTSLSIARARKGMGKSALIREAAFRASNSKQSVVIEIKGSDLVAQKPYTVLTAPEYIHDWQQRICSVINRAIGSSIGIAITDDAISLVEAAELTGFKSRNIIGSLVDRLKGKFGPVELAKVGIQEQKQILGRFLGNRDERVLLLIDDIDATFADTAQERLRLSTFFSACREVVSSYTGISIRATVRSDVWAAIRRTDEALDKVEQYIFDIKWSKRQFEEFLRTRIVAYFHYLNRDLSLGAEPLQQVFDSNNVTLGREWMPWPTAIHFLAGGRPRWATQLCRMAGVNAMSTTPKQTHIKSGNITQILQRYGQYRIDDIAREYKNHCPAIGQLMQLFFQGQHTFDAETLNDYLANKSSKLGKVSIEDADSADVSQIIKYLFRVGFLVGTTGSATKDQVHLIYESFPDLLSTSSVHPEQIYWRVHPMFHAALSIQRPE